jgi:hypothetical protein
MNMGEIPKKKSVLDFVFKGMWKMGFNSMFKTEHDRRAQNLRKNSKSERFIFKSEEMLDDSEDKISLESKENEKDFSRELEK